MSINSYNEVIWLNDGKEGMQVTSQTISEGDEVTFGKFKAKIVIPDSEETKAEKRARLLKELAELEG